LEWGEIEPLDTFNVSRVTAALENVDKSGGVEIESGIKKKSSKRVSEGCFGWQFHYLKNCEALA